MTVFHGPTPRSLTNNSRPLRIFEELPTCGKESTLASSLMLMRQVECEIYGNVLQPRFWGCDMGLNSLNALLLVYNKTSSKEYANYLMLQLRANVTADFSVTLLLVRDCASATQPQRRATIS